MLGARCFQNCQFERISSLTLHSLFFLFSLLFFLRFSLFFGAFFPSLPWILRVQQEEESLFFLGQKNKDGRVTVLSNIYSVSELRRACFRQARVAQAMLPPSGLFHAATFALPPRAHKSHLCPLPHVGFSESFTCSYPKNLFGLFLTYKGYV